MKDIFGDQEDAVQKAMRDYWIKMDKYSINDDGSVDVYGNVKIPETARFLKELPLQFNKVTGDFDCSRLSLTTLKGSPVEVGGSFNCIFNPLLSLENAPKIVNGIFVFDNMIGSLFTGGLNCNFKDVVMVFRTGISSKTISKKLSDLEEYLPIIFKYQNYYDIWNDDKSLNDNNFDELVEDLRDGLE